MNSLIKILIKNKFPESPKKIGIVINPTILTGLINVKEINKIENLCIIFNNKEKVYCDNHKSLEIISVNKYSGTLNNMIMDFLKDNSFNDDDNVSKKVLELHPTLLFSSKLWPTTTSILEKLDNNVLFKHIMLWSVKGHLISFKLRNPFIDPIDCTEVISEAEQLFNLKYLTTEYAEK